MLKRKMNSLLSMTINSQYNNKINYKNIESIFKLKVWYIFKNEKKHIKEWYIYNTIKDWYNQQNNYDRETYIKLKKILKKHKVKLSIPEKAAIFKIEERIFMTERALKKLDTFIPMQKKENVFAKFELVKLFCFKDDSEYISKTIEGELSITNQRFIIEIEKSVPNKVFQFSKIQEYTYTNYGFKFKSNNIIYVIRIHDAIVLNNIIKLIFRKKVKNVIKKHKNY
ncbi:MAG: hypothetical protein GY679_02400 [Mycoplasma sp.]|nr:hypothetical protein [Mycoplasma sp.]